MSQQKKQRKIVCKNNSAATIPMATITTNNNNNNNSKAKSKNEIGFYAYHESQQLLKYDPRDHDVVHTFKVAHPVVGEGKKSSLKHGLDDCPGDGG